MKDKFNLVGTKIKEFSLPNSRGEIKSIKGYIGIKNVLIILFRSKNWPYARAHAKKLNKDLDKFRQLDTVLYPILPDNLDAAIKMEQNYAKRYPIYYDEKKEVNKMLKQEVKPLKFGRMPALLIIDKKGTIRYAYYSDSMDDIPKNEEILENIKKINK